MSKKSKLRKILRLIRLLKYQSSKGFRLKDFLKSYPTKSNSARLKSFFKKRIARYCYFKRQTSPKLLQKKRQSIKFFKRLGKGSTVKHVFYRRQNSIVRYSGNSFINNYVLFLKKNRGEYSLRSIRGYKNAEILLTRLAKLQLSLEKKVKKVTTVKSFRAITKVLEKISFIVVGLKGQRRKN